MEMNFHGGEVQFRVIAPSDAPKLIAGINELSSATRFARFFFLKTGFSSKELDTLTRCDGINHFAIVAELTTEPKCPLVAVGRWIRDTDDSATADIAMVVRDDWQGRGIGTILTQLIAREAREKGIMLFRAQTLWGNAAVIKLLETVGTLVEQQPIGSGASELIFRLHAALETQSKYP